MDLSHLDKKYFLDDYRYNCPSCNRGSVRYDVIDKISFNWSDEKIAFGYLVRCGENNCQKVSFHLSYFNFLKPTYGHYFEVRPDNLREETEYKSAELDGYFFFHQPTSFFTIDSRVNETLRELLSEAENSLKMNFLVGASACLRKTIYELIDIEKVRVVQENGRTDYQESIKRLKNKFAHVPKEYFDALGNIQELASDKVHEGSWEAWNVSKLKLLIELTKNVLHEMYIVPEEQKGRVGIVGKLMNEFKNRGAADTLKKV